MASVSKELIDEIKSKNDIVDVIGSYIDLNDKNKALCPFHDDHSPSFSVHPDKQIYKCFSCGESVKEMPHGKHQLTASGQDLRQ